MSDCLICINPLEPPVKVLSCGHSFCTPCVEALIANNRTPRDVAELNFNRGMTPLLCPTCRTATYLPRRNRIRALPTNHALNHILLRRRLRRRQQENNNDVQQPQNFQRNETIDRKNEIDNRLSRNDLILASSGDTNNVIDEMLMVDDENSHYESMFEATIAENVAQVAEIVWYCDHDWCATVNYEFRTNCRLCFSVKHPPPGTAAVNDEGWGGAQRVTELGRRLRSNGNVESFWRLL